MVISRRRQPQALPHLECTALIDLVLRHHSAPTTLIICSTREDFLEELQACIRRSSPCENGDNSVIDRQAELHPLLIPTLHLIATSRTVNLAFTPTVPHLRAYISVYDPCAKAIHSPPVRIPRSDQIPMLVIWGLAALHRSTIEHSVQGLCRTLASAVEAAYVAGQKLILAEPAMSEGLENDDDPDGMQTDPWKEQVPLLSSSVKVAGSERVLAGRTVEVGKIVGRWCRFAEFQ